MTHMANIGVVDFLVPHVLKHILVKPCDICGDVGFEDCIVTCDQCKVVREHVYCMRYHCLIAPDNWICEQCCSGSPLVSEKLSPNNTPHVAPNLDLNGVIIHENKESLLGKEEPVHAVIDAREGASFEVRENEATCKSSFPSSLETKTKSCISTPSSRRSRKKLSVSWNLDEKEPSNAPVTPKEGRTYQMKAAQTHRTSTCMPLAAVQPQSITLSGNRIRFDTKTKISGGQRRFMYYDLLNFEKYLSNRPNLEATWKGNFEVHDEVPPCKLYVGFQAHLPRIFDPRVHKFSKQMPEVLQFKLLPRCDIWAEIFQGDWAFGRDISLYFFPGNSERSINQYNSLLELIEMQDLVMKSCMNNIELLIFTSMQLHYTKESNWVSFLWGFFRVVKNECGVATRFTARTSQADMQTANFGTLVRQRPSEVNKRRLNDNVSPDFTKKAASKPAHKVILEKLSLDLVDVRVKNDQAVSRTLASDSEVASVYATPLLEKRPARPSDEESPNAYWKHQYRRRRRN